MHIWMGLHMWENRYRQFKDKKWDCTCGRRGTNKKVGLYMCENVPPDQKSLAEKLLTCGLGIYFGSEMLIMIRVRALAYLLLALAECNE